MLTFDLRDQDKAELRELATFLERLGTMPPPASRKAVADTVRQGYLENFRTESAAGVPWAPLAPATIKDRIRRGYPGPRPKLVREGDYRRSWTQPGGDNVEEWHQGEGWWNVVVGSTDYRVPFHELGTNRMPARKVNRLSRQMMTYIYYRIENYIRQQEPKA
jgi:hypothetical protein